MLILKALCDIRVEVCKYFKIKHTGTSVNFACFWLFILCLLYVVMLSSLHEYLWHILQQEDIRTYIESSLKQGIQLTAFRRERIGGDSHGISYW